MTKQLLVGAGVLLFLIVIVMLYFCNGMVFTKNNISEEMAIEIADEYVQYKLSADELQELDFEEIEYWDRSDQGLSKVYKINYKRIIRGIQSLDGVQLRVDADTGKVSTYRKTWSTDEDETAHIDTEPSISSSEAIKIIKNYMNNKPTIGKKKADSVTVVNSELVWKEDNNDTIHLTWWIQFKDSTFAYDDSPAAAWIDAHSGEMILFVYSRD